MNVIELEISKVLQNVTAVDPFVVRPFAELVTHVSLCGHMPSFTINAPTLEILKEAFFTLEKSLFDQSMVKPSLMDSGDIAITFYCHDPIFTYCIVYIPSDVWHAYEIERRFTEISI